MLYHFERSPRFPRSEWTQWTECSEQCGPGRQMHERLIEVHASWGGNACDQAPHSDGFKIASWVPYTTVRLFARFHSMVISLVAVHANLCLPGSAGKGLLLSAPSPWE